MQYFRHIIYIKVKTTIYVEEKMHKVSGMLKLIMWCATITLVLSSFSFIYITSGEEFTKPKSLDKWRYVEEIKIPIETTERDAIYQPIDIEIEFKNPCWARNEEEYSIRVFCLKENELYELESQIYNLRHSDPNHIIKCNLVFLVPEIADGNEKYFLCYDKDEKEKANYVDHVSVEDAYFYYEPISNIIAEGDYYKIVEDGYIVYGVGQKGRALNRYFSQVVLKQKPGTKEFGLLNSDNLASFGFGYYEGPTDEYEKSSDQKLVSKGITVDGNLMVEFKIVSESEDGNLRTEATYRYYYCPTEVKRISVHVRHRVLKNAKVSGIVNGDGRYASLFTFKSTSGKLEKMRFGELFPYLHVFTKDNLIREYRLSLDPEDKERKWIISYLDDCDIGKEGWISYDEGNEGKAHGIIFYSTNVVKSGANERDGIQVKVAEKEYLNVLGAEIDYVNINLGRNSYNKGGKQDLDIPDNFSVEFDAEFFTTELGGYNKVRKEANYYQNLVKYRSNEISYKEEPNMYTLTLTLRFTGRVLFNDFISNLTGLNLTRIYAELYRDDELVSKTYAFKPLIGKPKIKFVKLAPGNYTVKIYRELGNTGAKFIGFETVELNKDEEIEVVCTWERNLEIILYDQFNRSIENVELIVFKNDNVVTSSITTGDEGSLFYFPFSFKNDYVLKGFYKGFEIYNATIPVMSNKIDVKIDLFCLTVNIKDTLGLPPGVELRPLLTSYQMIKKQEIYPTHIYPGTYKFEDLPSSIYTLKISYGSFSKEEVICIPGSKSSIEIVFPVEHRLNIKLLDKRGGEISKDGREISVYRGNKKLLDKLSADKINLPPGRYTIYVESDGKGIGIKNIMLTSDTDLKIVTTEESIISLVILTVTIIFIFEMFLLMLVKKVSFNSFLKSLAISLIIISLISPWWSLHASTLDNTAEKNSEMFLVPQIMIENLRYNGEWFLDIATIPNVFIILLQTLFFIVLAGCILLSLSFLPNIIYKKRFYKLLIGMSVLFLILVSFIFFIGMSKIIEISLGSLLGEGMIQVSLPNEEVVYMKATWGLSSGFYLCVIAAIVALSAGIFDLAKRFLNK